jgi:Predicted membrane protein (DUF2142)
MSTVAVPAARGRSLSWPRALKLPRGAVACGLVALCCGIAWSLVTPPFEVPDENAHYAYVQQIAERGALPRRVPVEGRLSPREDAILGATGFYFIVGQPGNPAPMAESEQRVIDRIDRSHLPAAGTGDALSASDNPPLYYALAAPLYAVAPGATVLNRLALMRLLSAVMGAVTVMLVWGLLRELLPGTPWAWTAGALAAALQPLFGFMSGGFNNDALLYLASAGVLFALARIDRRGLSVREGLLLGGFLGAGLLTKVTLLGLVPGVLLFLLIAVRRAWRSERRREAVRGGAVACALGGGPVLLYLAISRLSGSRSLVSGGLGTPPAQVNGLHYSFSQELSHVWQLFLPRLWLHPQFPHYFPLWHTWFRGFFGTFGWLDYSFSNAAFVAMAVVFGSVLALAAAELVRSRAALRSHLGLLAAFVVMLLGLCGEIGVQSYRYLVSSGQLFEQARYLLPLLGLYALLVALATRLPGRRWGPALGAAIVMLALAHTIFSQLLTVQRFYA